MTTRILRPLALVLLLACAAAVSSQAQAQSYPAKAVRVIVPLPAGGATDVIARAVSQRLSEMWGQQLVIENKGGANTQIGAEAVAKSAPDGYTLLATSESTLAVNPFLYRKLPTKRKTSCRLAGSAPSPRRWWCIPRCRRTPLRNSSRSPNRNPAS